MRKGWTKGCDPHIKLYGGYYKVNVFGYHHAEVHCFRLDPPDWGCSWQDEDGYQEKRGFESCEAAMDFIESRPTLIVRYNPKMRMAFNYAWATKVRKMQRALHDAAMKKVYDHEGCTMEWSCSCVDPVREADRAWDATGLPTYYDSHRRHFRQWSKAAGRKSYVANELEAER